MAQGMIVVHGLNEFRAAARSAVGDLRRGFGRQMSAALKAAGRPIVTHARSVVPRKTGALASSLSVSVRATKGSIVSRSPYAGGAEWGRHGKWAGWVSKHGAPPRFVWPSVEARQEEVIDILNEGLNDLITILGWAR